MDLNLLSCLLLLPQSQKKRGELPVDTGGSSDCVSLENQVIRSKPQLRYR